MAAFLPAARALWRPLCLVLALGLSLGGQGAGPALAQATSPVEAPAQPQADKPPADRPPVADAPLGGATITPNGATARPGTGDTGGVAATGAGATGGGLTKSHTTPSRSTTKSISVTPASGDGPDYAAWEALATRAERTITEGQASNSGLELLRGQLVDWRSKLQAAQSTNASRIQSLRDQITALGAAPTDGTEEAPEIADRRKQLNDQLQKAEAPGKAADEGYRRAAGLISEIDKEMRERQTAQLLKLWPTPANPANWGEAATAVGNSSRALWVEVATNWRSEARRTKFFDVLPGAIIMVLIALVLIFRGRRWIETFSNWLNRGADAARWRRVWSFVASLGQIVVPTAGVLLISVALRITELPGWLGIQVLTSLFPAGFALFMAYWLGGRIFPKGDENAGPLGLPEQVRSEARFLVTLIGLTQGAEVVREALFPVRLVAEAAVPVLALINILIMALLLWRFGHLINRAFAPGEPRGEAAGFRDGVIRIIGKLLIAIAVVGPLLGAVGYTTAAQALIFPAGSSLMLVGLLLVLVQLISDIWRAVLGEGAEEEGQGLLPVLAGFLLTLASLPLFALLWGARVEDLGELWNRFTEGFMLGETRISPSNFLYFLILFILGYGATRLFQGALRSSILPKTRLDQGGRNAIVSGTGYVGIFLAVIVAVSAAGINLSGLAIVASALTVGIGFGLQNIVQNFVSGIILLIERPVSEGDWIEVGNVSGIVQSISVRSTRIQTFDRSDIIVPNGDLVSQRVTNWTRFSLTGRVVVPISVKFGQDTRKVTEILREIAEAQPLALLNPMPSVYLVGMAADSLNFEIRMLIRDVNFAAQVRSEVNHRVVERFIAEGILLSGTPSSSPSRVEDVATVLEAMRLASPDELARMAPARESKSSDPAEPTDSPAPSRPTEPGDPLDDETER
ncbi:DUF3772 domain-containing protein [Gemmobacter serpentinus]|uniref:DUF3772 domain-containing protein n=1 Tax=Gemmobacter serpentinus TaxID=2652247 RepID=UPI001865768A|nr:DUF3772 domain-containing protein [Gemmobacter serpentinus]